MKKETKNSFVRKDAIILGLILLIGLVFRLYKINAPLADFFSWRQADTAAVARNFVQNDFDLLHPRYDDLSNIQSGQENPQGFRMVELPIYQAIMASVQNINPSIPIEIYGRAITIFFSLIVVSILYFFLLREEGRLAAFIGSGTYATLPFFVFFSRVVLPETTALAFTFIGLLLLYLFAHANKRAGRLFLYFSSIIFFGLGILTKPTVIFYSIAALYLFFRKYRFHFATRLPFYVYFILSFAPFLLWRFYITSFPEGIPVSEWLITSVNTPDGRLPIFFRPSFFRWIFFERINGVILGGFLTVFFVLGALAKQRKYFLHAIILSGFAFLFTFQGGNVQHEYYQTIILPGLAIAIAQGVVFVSKNAKLFITPAILYPSIIALFVFSYFFSFYRVRDYYDHSQSLVNIARVIQDVTRQEDKIITDTTGDTTLLYLSNRRGSPAPFKDLSELKKDGYVYFITQSSEVIENLRAEGREVVASDEGNKFAIFRL